MTRMPRSLSKDFLVVVWAKTNAGMGSLYRSQHELFPLFKKGIEAHVNNVELRQKKLGRRRMDDGQSPPIDESAENAAVAEPIDGGPDPRGIER